MNKDCHPRCKSGNHPLMKVYSVGDDSSENVVRWCPECGAIVIDVDSDGRTNPGAVMKMRIPTISK